MTSTLQSTVWNNVIVRHTNRSKVTIEGTGLVSTPLMAIPATAKLLFSWDLQKYA